MFTKFWTWLIRPFFPPFFFLWKFIQFGFSGNAAVKFYTSRGRSANPLGRGLAWSPDERQKEKRKSLRRTNFWPLVSALCPHLTVQLNQKHFGNGWKTRSHRQTTQFHFKRKRLKINVFTVSSYHHSVIVFLNISYIFLHVQVISLLYFKPSAPSGILFLASISYK